MNERCEVAGTFASHRRDMRGVRAAIPSLDEHYLRAVPAPIGTARTKARTSCERRTARLT